MNFHPWKYKYMYRIMFTHTPIYKLYKFPIRLLISTTIYNNKIKLSKLLGMDDLKLCHGNILVMPVSGAIRLKPCWIVACFIPSWWQWCLPETHNEGEARQKCQVLGAVQTKLTHFHFQRTRNLRFFVVIACQRRLPSTCVHACK